MEELADLVFFLENVGKDPSGLIFDDVLTGIKNRRFFSNFFEFKVKWGALKANPVSMLLIDVDGFTKINDEHGQGVGDDVLIHTAKIIKEIAGEYGQPVRYGGDEFIILLPGKNKKTALSVGKYLIRATHEKPFLIEETGLEFPVTLSIGIVTAPDDADSEKTLMEKADTALSIARDSGGDRLLNAVEIAPEAVPAEAAIHRDAAKNAGRKTHLAQVSAVLKKFGKRESQFVIIEGGHGMGKSTFLDTIDRKLSKTRVARIKVEGITQELFRPYYLISNVTKTLLLKRKDRGTKVFETLDPVSLAALSSSFMPKGSLRIHARQAKDVDLGNDAQKRQHVFNAMVKLIPMLVKNRPLIILMDDLHLADEASLLVMGHLFTKKSIPLFLCGTAPDTLQTDGGKVPLERFIETNLEQIPFETVRLTSLTSKEIAAHFDKLYPGVKLPENFCAEVVQVSQGNPLFFNGVLFKLVFDGKVRIIDGKWVVDPLEQGYLPRSMDEIVAQKVASLDEESKHLLDQVSVFGEGVSLSQLTKSSEMNEVKVLDFLDKAAAQGLVSSEFHMNDENIRFLGNQVRQVIYGNIDDKQKEKLHENIGDYQETLYKKRLMPSPAILAYHYQRSANLEKAKTYEQLQSLQSDMIFNAGEAAQYTGEPVEADDAQAPDEPLAPEQIAHVPKTIRSFLISIRNTKLYPEGSELTANAVTKFKDTIEAILEANPRLNIIIEKDVIFANGEELDPVEIKSIAGAFLNFMNNLELKGITINSGVSLAELVRLIEGLGQVDGKHIHERFWKEFSTQNRLKNVQLKQITYTQVSTSQAVEGVDLKSEKQEERELDKNELIMAARVIKTLLGSGAKLKLYPADGPVASKAIDAVVKTISAFLAKYPFLTLAGVDKSLLLNGVRIDSEIYEKLTPFFLNFLKSTGLKSLTFFKKAVKRDLVAFLSNTVNCPKDESADEFWFNIAKEHGISTILFNQAVYGVLAEHIAADGVGLGTGGGAQADEEQADSQQKGGGAQAGKGAASETAEESGAGPGQEISLEPSVDNIRNLFLKGNESGVARVLENLFSGYPEHDEQDKKQVLDTCQELLTAPDLAPESRFGSLVVDPLLAVFPGEDDPQLLEDMASLLYDSAQNFIRIGEYSLATWIFGHFSKRREQMDASDESALMPEALNRQPDPDMEKLLADDVISGEPFRRQAAFALIGGLGPVAVKLLIDIIKANDDLRTRQIAATQIKKIGPQAVDSLKHELVVGTRGKIKARILEVIDTVTTDLKTELTFAMADANSAVRKEGFALASRINDPMVAELLRELATSNDPGVAADAIQCIGEIGVLDATGIIAGQLDVNKDADFLVACCQSLGRLGEPAGIVPLSKVLSHKKTLFSRKEYASRVRAAAAFALAGIPHSLAKGAMARFADDGDTRVREAARKALET